MGKNKIDQLYRIEESLYFNFFLVVSFFRGLLFGSAEQEMTHRANRRIDRPQKERECVLKRREGKRKEKKRKAEQGLT